MVTLEADIAGEGGIPVIPEKMVKHHNVIKSANDDRLYRHITLENKLEILLISDESAEKSAAAVDVNIGMYIFTYFLCYFYWL